MGKGGEGSGGQGRGGEGKGRKGRGNLPPPPQNIFGLTPLELTVNLFHSLWILVIRVRAPCVAATLLRASVVLRI